MIIHSAGLLTDGRADQGCRAKPGAEETVPPANMINLNEQEDQPGWLGPSR